MQSSGLNRFVPFVVFFAAAIALNLMAVIPGRGDLPMAVVAAVLAVSALAAVAMLAITFLSAARNAGLGVAAALRSAKRSDFQINLFQILVFTTWVAVFLAARRYLSPPRNGDYADYLIKQFLLFLVVFVAATLPAALQQRRRSRMVEAARQMAADAPMPLEPVDDMESIDEIVSALDACPICSAPVVERGDCVGAANSTLATSPGNIHWTTCRACGSQLQGIVFYGVSPPDDCAGLNEKRAILWQAHITRKVAPSEINLNIEQSD